MIVQSSNQTSSSEVDKSLKQRNRNMPGSAEEHGDKPYSQTSSSSSDSDSDTMYGILAKRMQVYKTGVNTLLHLTGCIL